MPTIFKAVRNENILPYQFAVGLFCNTVGKSSSYMLQTHVLQTTITVIKIMSNITQLYVMHVEIINVLYFATAFQRIVWNHT